MDTSFRDLSPLLNPQGIAVIGATERPGSAGRLVLENLRNLNFPGKVFAVHPKHSQVLGFPCYPDIDSLPERVDMVAVLLGADKVLSLLDTAHQNGIKAAWILASGFSESGPEGEVRQQELIEFAQRSGMLINGPNCIGVVNMIDQFASYSVAIGPNTKPGNVSAILQSGAVCLGLANSARFGFRYLISSGNEAVLDSSDYIGHLVNDEKTKVIIAFLEGIRKPGQFIKAAKAAMEAGKPVLVVKVGRSDAARRAVQAHTGSLAGSDVVLDAIFKRYGIVRLGDLDELLEATQLFMTCPLPETEGVGLLSLSGGQIGLISDLAENLGLVFPPFTGEGKQALTQILPPFVNITNPLDAWGSGDLEKTYPACMDVVASEPHISMLAVARDTPPEIANREIEQSIKVAEAAVKARRDTGKPCLIFSNIASGIHEGVAQIAKDGGVPYLQGTRETLCSIQAFEDYASFRRNYKINMDAGVASPSNLDEWIQKLKANKSTLSEVEGRKLLSAYGIMGPKEFVARNLDEAIHYADEIGYPVVLKILSPDIQHKTEIGGVRVGLSNPDEVSSAYNQVMQSARQYFPNAYLEGVIIQEMVPSDSVEVILGMVKDKDFGPVVIFGTGGILVELIKDSALSLPPLSRQEAKRMIQSTRGYKLLLGFRGKPKADINALIEAMVGLSKLASDLGEHISALDINPLMVLPEGKGVRAVDALIELAN
jgi:acetate---CoA ligase (ADP-forming)